MKRNRGIIVPWNPSIMGINSPLCGESIDLVMRASYNKNAGFTLDANLALLVVDVGIYIRTRSYSDPSLKWDTGFLRPAFKVERRVAQTCSWNGMRGCSDPRLSQDARFFRPALDAKLLRLTLNTGLLRSASEVSVFLWTRCLRLSLKCDLHVEVRFAYDDLSLVIFGQPTEPPQKFSKFRNWLGWVLKYFGL